MPFSGSNYREGTLYGPQPRSVLDALSSVIWGWRAARDVQTDGAQISLQVENQPFSSNGRDNKTS